MRFTAFSFFIFFVLFIGQPNTSIASHTMGADLTYQCLGGDQYQITLSFYRDCSGISPDNKATIKINSASCNISTSIDLQKNSGTGQEITPICPTAKTTCNGGTYTGIEEYVYTGTYTLPKQCDDWIFSFEECCRNSAITTISSPSNQELYVEAHLDNLNVTGNSSPTFSNKPVPFVCIGELFCFNHGATDVDGDSLVYSLADPMTGPNSIVNYLAGYSASNPLKSNPVLTFDATNGNFCVTPTQLEVTVMAVLVQEYRNGVLIGTVTRDIQITDVNCNNENPSVDGINGSGNFDTTICVGTNYCFTTNSYDANAGQNVSMSWNSGIKNATFNTTNGSLPVGTFCWTPKSKDVSTVPHCFTVEVKDDNCPYNGIQTYSFCITVTGLSVDAGTDQSISCTNTTTLSGTASGGSGNYTYLWSTGDSIQTTVAGQGTHYLTVDDGAGCIGNDSVNVNYFDAPVANLSFATGCSNPINFTDATTISGGPTIISWQWDFGDGNTSTQQNPSNNYAQQGTYVVSLIATSSLGCPDTITKYISINAIPIANFSSTTICEGQTTNFTDLSSISNGSIASWLWDFGDGNSDNTQNPSHQYASAGTYTASLSITTDSNCTGQISYPVEVSSTPVASFTTNDICLNTAAVLTNTSTITFGSIAIYNWDMGDGTTYINSTNVTHQYASANNYTVSLTATSTGGCAATMTQILNVYAIPSASFSANNVCLGLAVPFSDLSTTNGSITNWEWNFNNGITSSEQNPNPVFTTPGQINASLVITDNNGCTDTATNAVNVYPMPLVSYSVQDICLKEPASFIDLSSIASGSIVSWQWDFNDGNTSTLTNPTHNYAIEGTYSTQLVVISDNGCLDSLEQIITVNPDPALVMILFSGPICEDSPGNFDNQSTISTGNIVSYNWDFGDGLYSSDVAPSHTYTSPGTYFVSLVGTSDKNCSDTLTSAFPITVNPKPISAFEYNPHETSILSPLISFYDQSSTDAYQFWWDFGDGTSSSAYQSPNHAYADTGTYSVELLVVNNYGCEDSVTYEVKINPDGILYIPNTFSPNNNDINDDFIAKGFGILDYEMFIYDRWGNPIYSCNDISKAWDGTIQNTSKPAPEDVYVYKIKVRVQPDKKHTYIGRVTLLR